MIDTRRSSTSVIITPKRVMSPAKENGLCARHDAISLEEGLISPKPPKGKSGGEKIFPEVQQMLRTKLNRIHAGLRKRRAMSIHEVQSNRGQQPIFYVPSPLTTSTSHHDSIRNIEEREDENDYPDGHLSLPPFAFRDQSPCKTKELQRKPSSTCSSSQGTGSLTEELDRGSHRSSASSGHEGQTWNRDPGYHSIESQSVNYDATYCDKWTSPAKDTPKTKEQYDFIHASERRNSVKFAVNEPVRQIERTNSPTKYSRGRQSEHSKVPRPVSEMPKNSFMIGSLVTNQFIGCSSVSAESGPPSLPYGVSVESEPRKDRLASKAVPARVTPVPPARTNPPIPPSRGRTRSQSPLKKEKKHLRKTWTDLNKNSQEEVVPPKRIDESAEVRMTVVNPTLWKLKVNRIALSVLTVILLVR